MKQQLRSEQALQKREAELQMVLQNANDAYVCIDHTGVIRKHEATHDALTGLLKEGANKFLI